MLQCLNVRDDRTIKASRWLGATTSSCRVQMFNKIGVFIRRANYLGVSLCVRWIRRVAMIVPLTDAQLKAIRNSCPRSQAEIDQDLAIVRHWLDKQPHLPKPSESFTIPFRRTERINEKKKWSRVLFIIILSPLSDLMFNILNVLNRQTVVECFFAFGRS